MPPIPSTIPAARGLKSFLRQEPGALESGMMIMIHGKPKAGKAQPLSAKLLTPTGWTTMGAIQPGMQVVGASGRPTTVTGVFPQGRRPIYRVVTSTGASTTCDAEHLWYVKARNDWKVLTLQEIMDRGLVGTKTGLPRMGPARFVGQAVPLPIDPYCLGVILGDGCLTQGGVHVASSSPHIFGRVAARLPASLTAQWVRDQHEMTIVGTEYRKNPYVAALQTLELSGCRAEAKFIPSCYLWASVEDRLELLRGLMDTDGSINPTGKCEYYTVSARLADDVTHLARSLGALVRRRLKADPVYTYKGARYIGQSCHVLAINFPRDVIPVTKPDKLERYMRRPQGKAERTETIKEVIYLGEEEAQCIAVGAPDSLYVTDDFLVTHNTTLAATASQFFRPEGDARLSDMLFLVADMDGLGALDSQGLVPWSINLLELWNAHGFRKGNSILRSQLKALLVEEPGIKVISVSSLTSFDIEANAEFYDTVSARADIDGGSFDGYAAFRDVLGEHRMLISALARTGCDIIYEAHSVAQSVATDAKGAKTPGQVKKESLQMVGGGSIVPDITGKAQAIYNRHVSVQLAIIAKTLPGNKVPTRTVHTLEAADMQAGSKYEKFLDPVEQFDLRAILGKIRAAKAKSPAGAEGDTK